MLRKYLIFIYLFILASCDSSDDEHGSTTTVKFDMTNLSSGETGDYFDEMKTLVIDKKEILIGKIKQVLACGKDYIVYDAYSKKIYKIDANGHLLLTIGGFGQAPGQYLEIASLSVNDSLNQLIVSDIQSKLTFYDLNTGVLKKEIKYPLAPLYYFHYFDNKYYTFNGRSGTSKFQVTFLNDSLKAVNDALSYKVNTSVCFSPIMPLQTSNNHLYCLPIYEQVIYQLNDSKFIPAYILDFGKYNMPIEELENNPKYNKNQDWLENNEKEDFTMFLNYYMLDQNLFFTFSLHGNNLFGIYNVKNQKTEVIDKITDLPFLKNNYPVGVVNGSVVFAIDCDKIDMSRKYPTQLSKLFASVRPDDNQIILILKPKT